MMSNVIKSELSGSMGVLGACIGAIPVVEFGRSIVQLVSPLFEAIGAYFTRQNSEVNTLAGMVSEGGSEEMPKISSQDMADIFDLLCRTEPYHDKA